MSRTFVLAYGATSYLIFLGSFLYAIGFVGDFAVPRSIDSGTPGPLAPALLMDTALLLLFAVPHSVMARPAFKSWWARFVPPVIERSTYVLVSSLILIFLYWQWRPAPIIVWGLESPLARRALDAAFWAGWAVALVSTFLIDHFDLFGLRQVYFYATGRNYSPPVFRSIAFYRLVRHPIMSGFLIAFWSAPTMTVGRLLFATATTAYVLIALRLEERDLEAAHGAAYRDYRARVGMLVPRPRSAAMTARPR